MADTQVKNETALTSFDGNEVLYVVDDPSGTPADRKVEIRHMLPDGGRLPYFQDADVYNVQYGLAGLGSGALTANRLYMIPIFMGRRRACTTIAAIVTTAGAASTVGRMGVYNASPTTGQPTTLIAEGGAEVATDSTGLKTATIAQTLDPGWYFLAFVGNGTPTTAAPSTSLAGTPLGVTMTTGASLVYGLYRTFTYAALPADESAQTYTKTLGVTVPLLGIR